MVFIIFVKIVYSNISKQRLTTIIFIQLLVYIFIKSNVYRKYYEIILLLNKSKYNM